MMRLQQHFHFILRQSYPLSKYRYLSFSSDQRAPLRVALYRRQDAGLLIGVRRRQGHLRRYVAFGIDAIDASLVAGLD